MEKGDKFTQQNKNTKPYYWFTPFKVYLCISGGYNYYLQWWTIFRQCQEQSLIQEVKNPMGKEKCSKKTFTASTLQQKGMEWAAWEAYGSRIAHVWPPRNHHTVLISAKDWNKPLFDSLWMWDIRKKMLDYWSKASYNLPQWFSVGLLDTSWLWKPHQMLIQCRKPKFWCHLGLPQLVVNTKWFKLGLTDTSACRNSIKCVPLVALCIGIAALDMCRKKGNVSRWSISSSKANTLPPFHCSLHLTLLSHKGGFFSNHVNHPDYP